MPALEHDSAVLEKTEIMPPRLWKVIYHNDDYTPFDFVIASLVQVFDKTTRDADAIAKKVHRDGAALVALYPKGIAKTKVDQVMQAAGRAGFPLQVTCEPDEDTQA